MSARISGSGHHLYPASIPLINTAEAEFALDAISLAWSHVLGRGSLQLRVKSLSHFTRKSRKSRRAQLLPYLQHCRMPPQRIPLGLVSGNRQFNRELTPYQRGVAIGMTFKGAKSSEIEVALDYSCGALRSTLKFAHLCDQGNSQPRAGAPKACTNADECNLLRHIRKKS